MLTKLLSLGVTAEAVRRYDQLKIGVFCSNWVSLAQDFRYNGSTLTYLSRRRPPTNPTTPDREAREWDIRAVKGPD